MGVTVFLSVGAPVLPLSWPNRQTYRPEFGMLVKWKDVYIAGIVHVPRETAPAENECTVVWTAHRCYVKDLNN